MSLVDPIANFLTVIRNASRVNHKTVNTPASNTTIHITEILKKEKFIKEFRVVEEENKRFLRIHLRYFRDGRSAIRGLDRVSKPGLRRYVDADNVPRVLNGLGIAILSTSQGVMSDRSARKNRVGGEVLCKVY